LIRDRPRRRTDGTRRLGVHPDQQAARGVYIGVTADIVRRIWQHRNSLGSAFVRKYGLDRLVRVEAYPTIEEAIAREKQLKNWH